MPRVLFLVVLAGSFLLGCQDQQPEPIAPQASKGGNQPTKPDRTLTVTGAGTGFGTVTAPEYGESGAFHCAIGAGTSDPLECSRAYGWKTTVELTATPNPGSAFAGWSGACTGTASICRVVMTQSRDVRASFSGGGVATYTLNVSGSGTGSGKVVSQAGLLPAIDCTITAGSAGTTGCSATYNQGASVTLTATPVATNTFSGWSGNCTGTGSCAITMSSNRAVNAGFAAPPPPEATSGRWDAAASTNVVGLHLVQMPNGKGIMWGHMGEPYIWNGPGAGEVQVPNNTCTNPTTCELFCAGHAFLADGRLLVAGGHNESLGDLHGINQASVFDGTSWTKTGYMADPRWYPTLVTLANGDVLAISGSKSPGILSTIPERYSNGTWTRLTGIDKLIPAYARAFVEPKAGNVFIADGDVHELNPTGLGSWSAGVGPTDPDRSYGPAVMLDSKVLFIGGGGKEPCPSNLPRKTAEIIDLAGAPPTWGPAGTMEFGRRQANATILPDGTVLVTGGTSLCGFSNESGAVYAAELWNPATQTFTRMANASVVRVYHSTTMLLADGRVMSTGGGDGANVVSQRNYEIFSPPYLFKGARPTYTLGGGTNIHYGQQFVISTPDAASIQKITIIRLASTTHAFDMGQRLNTLTFTAGAGSLTVTPPASGQIAPPGPYRLFLINNLGVPSVGQTILLNQ